MRRCLDATKEIVLSYFLRTRWTEQKKKSTDRKSFHPDTHSSSTSRTSVFPGQLSSSSFLFKEVKDFDFGSHEVYKGCLMKNGMNWGEIHSAQWLSSVYVRVWERVTVSSVVLWACVWYCDCVCVCVWYCDCVCVCTVTVCGCGTVIVCVCELLWVVWYCVCGTVSMCVVLWLYVCECVGGVLCLCMFYCEWCGTVGSGSWGLDNAFLNYKSLLSGSKKESDQWSLDQN